MTKVIPLGASVNDCLNSPKAAGKLPDLEYGIMAFALACQLPRKLTREILFAHINPTP